MTVALRSGTKGRGVQAVGRAGAPGLPVGTRIQLREGTRLTGTVMVCPPPEWSFGLLGLFSVRLDNGIWQICNANDVTVLAPQAEETDQ
ncbi:MAG: hypothetical protein ACRDRA_06885 [Pseudonocardiaceae bacterium]